MHRFSGMIYAIVSGLIAALPAVGQEQFQWPVTPFDQNHYITGNFSEYRSTTTPAHFHNGTDIPKPDGSPVYPVKDGTVQSLSAVGSNAYVRVGDKAYVHILPNPSLNVGDPVYAGVTVLGTILPGQGHVHFTNGYVGSERNSMLMNSGLTPLDDPWPPIIRYIRFFENNTANEFSPGAISGRVDIVVKVDEQNGPPGYSTSVLNNGTYKIGYKIFDADTANIVYEPPGGGLRFRFDTKPSNSYTDIVFFKNLSNTGSHVYQVTNDVSKDNYWDTSVLPAGDYVVMAFTEDTRQNTDTAYVRVWVKEIDTEPPAQPVFTYTRGTVDGMRLKWFPNTEADLAGYRLYFSFDNVSWTLFKNEEIFTPAVTDTFLKQVLNTDVYFLLTAMDNSPVPNESLPSKVFGLSNGTSFSGKVLVVDGFDRTDGAWTQPFHSFIYQYGKALAAANFSFDTASDAAVADILIDLHEYPAVFWFVGDETDGGIFSLQEQERIQSYLENGGNLFVNGMNVARALHQKGAEDRHFLNEYLKASFVKRVPAGYQSHGAVSSVFDGMDFGFGQSPYQIDSIDVIMPGENGVASLQYDDTLIAGVQYEGFFGNGILPGRVVFTAIPFETISGDQMRNEFAGRILNFFFDVTSLEAGDEPDKNIPGEFALLPNYPNPFNPTTMLIFKLPQSGEVRLEIFDLTGRKIRTLTKGSYTAGTHRLIWNGKDDRGRPAASGIYVYRLQSGEFVRARKMILVK